MKASQVVKELNKLIEKHGDKEVFIDYDLGVKDRVNTIGFVNHKARFGRRVALGEIFVICNEDEIFD